MAAGYGRGVVRHAIRYMKDPIQNYDAPSGAIGSFVIPERTDMMLILEETMA